MSKISVLSPLFAALLLTAHVATASVPTEAATVTADEAIAAILKTAQVEKYTDHNPNVPQALMRKGPGGCAVSLFETPAPYHQLVISVVAANSKVGSAVHLMDDNTHQGDDQMSTFVTMKVYRGALHVSYARVGTDDGYKINEHGFVSISQDGNIVTIQDDETQLVSICHLN